MLQMQPNLADGDAFYAALIDKLNACSGDEPVAFLGRLVLILANQIGDQQALLAALEAARLDSDERRP